MRTVNARVHGLDGMSDREAIVSLEGEFAGWMISRGTDGLCYGSVYDAGQRNAVRGEDWADLRDEIIRWIWRHVPGGG